MQKPIEIKVDNQSIRGILENPNSDKLIILVHGFSGNMHGPNNIFDKLSQRLQENGIAVLRFNFRGTKPSDMEQQEMTIESETADLKAAIKFAKSYSEGACRKRPYRNVGFQNRKKICGRNKECKAL